MAPHLYQVFENHKLKLNGLLKVKNNDIELISKQINKGRKDVEKLLEEISQMKDIVQVFIFFILLSVYGNFLMLIAGIRLPGIPWN